MGEVIWGTVFGKDRELELAWKAVRAELESLVDLEVIYESPRVADRLHNAELSGNANEGGALSMHAPSLNINHPIPMWSDDTANQLPSDSEPA